ncbi:unnamed protein product [Boreogadus saida]
MRVTQRFRGIRSASRYTLLHQAPPVVCSIRLNPVVHSTRLHPVVYYIRLHPEVYSLGSTCGLLRQAPPSGLLHPVVCFIRLHPVVCSTQWSDPPRAAICQREAVRCRPARCGGILSLFSRID